MSRQSFAERWELDPHRRAALSAVVEGVATADRMIAQLEAAKAHLLAGAQDLALQIMAELGGPSSYQLPLRAIAAEIAAATTASDASIRGRMDEAAVLVDKFPATLATLSQGRISRAHASVVVQEGLRLADAAARTAYEQRLLDRAPGLSAAQLRPVAKHVAEQVEPTTFVERHEAAREQRRVWVEDVGDGMSVFSALVESTLAHGMHDRVTQLARTVKSAARAAAGTAFGELDEDDDAPLPTDDRTLAQLRADTFAELVLTGHPDPSASAGSVGDALGAIRATVQVTIPADTIAGGSRPAVLAGYGPIDPETARRLAGGTHTWARLFVDADTGCLRTVDAYTPTAEQKRFLTARDEHCRFPGCIQPARRCDFDHTTAYADGGATAVTNLAALCRAHHMLKHHSPWRVTHRAGGVLEWTTPTGRTVATAPAPVVRFMPDPGTEGQAPRPG
ncbi:HNH endonuclease signature motif containing protein [Microbacterium album]|uniref:HNH nuclease domain-containing protein n=1 Tax=Microbacterium album TaxID=2053191 RepID=A0A917IJ68_9MICO|nr:HNH endonuclease signature motif containing protein [Microbacterium album]GGH50132.1 hypothetical protein GCM10010921_28660 [Microbacterium album]